MRSPQYLLWEWDQVHAIGGAELEEWKAELWPEERDALLALLWGRVMDSLPFLRAYLDALAEVAERVIGVIEGALGVRHA